MGLLVTVDSLVAPDQVRVAVDADAPKASNDGTVPLLPQLPIGLRGS